MSVLDDFRRARPLLLEWAADIHPERWKALGVPEAGAARLAGCPRARAALSESADWLMGGEAGGADDFAGWTAALAEKPGAWALRSERELWRAGRFLGAGRHRAEIARLIRREDVTAFQAAAGVLGREAVFAVAVQTLNGFRAR